MNRFKINRLPALAAAVILVLALCGCGARTASSSSGAVSSAASSSAQTQSSSSNGSATPSSSAEGTSSGGRSEGAASAASSAKTGKNESGASASSAPKSANSSAAPSKPAAKYVTLTIDATKGGDGVVASSKRVEICEGDTVYSVLKSYCDKNNIILAASKSGKGVYVSAIDGVAQFDNGPQSGWIYSVDGVFSQQDCNSYKLKGGENIKWVYTTDLGKSEGSVK